MSRPPRLQNPAGFSCLFLFTCLFGAEFAAAREPRLLLGPADVVRLRHVCGTNRAPAPPPEWGRFGGQALEFQALRRHLSQRVGAELLPGELAAIAFVHLVDPNDPADERRLHQVEEALRAPRWDPYATIERLLAIDWCWNALPAEARGDFLLILRPQALPLTPADSPLRPREFAEKLVGLALAAVVSETDDPSESWRNQRAQLVSAARNYFDTTFPKFVAWRGLAPTSPTAGPSEERDTALALEFAHLLLDEKLWEKHDDSVGRWLEHYALASFAHPALQRHFIRDDGNLAPLTPAPRYGELLPITAHLIAARTRDPSATLIAQRVAQRLRGPAADPLAAAWQWTPLLFDLTGIARLDVGRLPTSRDLRGAIVLRGRSGDSEVGVWIDAGQSHLRQRQHFDAGHFLIQCDGRLTVDSGEDVTFEAVRTKGGAQHLGRGDALFEFEQYFTATTAHNCLLLWDPTEVPRWHSDRYIPAGGQRLIEDTCTDFTGSAEANPRQTATRIAYGQDGNAAYLALDLTPAYAQRPLEGYTREFLFIDGCVLLVIDRLALRNDRPLPVVLTQTPVRPIIEGEDLPAASRLAGADNTGGIWRLPVPRRLAWSAQESEAILWMYPLQPGDGVMHIAGGPAKRQAIPEGPFAGQEYVGGEADSFERLALPASARQSRNAWFRLGAPTLLGPAFAAAPVWGRVELQPAQRLREYAFIVGYVVQAERARAPELLLREENNGWLVDIATPRAKTIVRLPKGQSLGGEVRFADLARGAWTLPQNVQPDPALPLLKPD